MQSGRSAQLGSALMNDKGLMNEPLPTIDQVRWRRGRWVLWGVILAAIVTGIYYSDGVAGRLRAATHWIAHSGFWGMISYIGIYIVACVFMVPGSILTVSAGAAFGLARGV